MRGWNVQGLERKLAAWNEEEGLNGEGEGLMEGSGCEGVGLRVTYIVRVKGVAGGEGRRRG